jgi:hypothetical protein
MLELLAKSLGSVLLTEQGKKIHVVDWIDVLCL